MYKRQVLFLAVAVLALVSCEKKVTAGLNDANKRLFDAWMHVNHPDLEPTALGCYVLDNTDGDGVSVADAEQYPYIRVNYTSRTLDGSIVGTSVEKMAQQAGSYEESSYYGPIVWTRSSVYAGIEEALETMNVGGSRTLIVPGWLMTTSRYDTAQDYLNNVSGTNAIYDFEIVEAIDDIEEWELDSLYSFAARNYGVTPADTVKHGMFYRQLAQPSSNDQIPTDSTIYINYTGRLLNGRVFDTTIRDTAKRYGLYDSSKTYEPVQISYDSENYTQITMGESASTVIDGFAYTIYLMHSHEKGVGIFYSGLGYSGSGSGDAIPAYSPLMFEIEVVDKPED